MLRPERLQRDAQFHRSTPVDGLELIVLQLDDVALLIGHDLGHLQKLTGLIRQQHGEGEYAAPANQAMLHQAAHGDY